VTAPRGGAPYGARVTDEGTQAARPGVAARLASRLDTGSLLYGTIVSAAALAVGAGRGETAFGMDETMIATLVVYWLAHVYTATVRERRPGSGTPLYGLLRHSARSEATILLGGVPAVVVTTALALAGVTLWPTVLSVLATAIVMLVAEGALAALYAGVRGWRLAAEAASAAVLGAILAALLVALHEQ
jgi:hypothetical protein